MADLTPNNAVPLAEAARLLGISSEAVRMRIKRGTLRAWRGNRGRLMVLLPEQEADPTPTQQPPAADPGEIVLLKERVAALEAERTALRVELATASAQASERAAEIERLHGALQATATAAGSEPPTFSATLRTWLARRLGTL